MYVCKYVYVRNVLKKTRLCEKSNNGNDLDIDGDESLFFRISAVVSSAFLKIFLPYYQWRYQPILW